MTLPAPHRLFARQGRGRDPSSSLVPSISATDDGNDRPTTETTTVPSTTPRVETTRTTPATPTEPPRSTSRPVETPTTSTTQDAATTSSTSTSTSTSSRTSSSARTSTPVNVGSINPGQTGTSSYVPTRTADDPVTSTVSASNPPDSTSAVAAGPIAGGILGALAGLALLGFVIAFFLRRLNRRNRRRRLAMRPQSEFSTFGNFGPSPEEKVDDEKTHNIAPSISSSVAMNITGYGAAATSNDVPAPSEALAASTAAAEAAAANSKANQLRERPKYVFGQAPADGSNTANAQTTDDVANGVYSSQPAPQAAYDHTAYADYAGYQDAERAYQAAAASGGYQGAYATSGQATGYYDQNGYYYAGTGDASASAGAYAAGAGQYYDYSQPYPTQQQQQQPGQGAYGGM